MKRFLLFLSIGGMVGIFAAISFAAGLFQGLEYLLEDLLFVERPIAEEIVILAIDDASLTAIGQWPWPRSVFAEFLGKLATRPPAIVGLDVMFAEPSRIGAADDEDLRRILAATSYPIVLPVEGKNLTIKKDGAAIADTLLAPLSLFAGPTVSRGHVNVIEDRDGIVRRFPAQIEAKTQNIPAFAYEIVRHVSSNVGSIPITLPDNAAPRIVYAGAPGKIRRISFSRILKEDIGTTLADKIVLVGVTATDLHDEKTTPVSSGTSMPGVEIHSHIANMLLQEWRLQPVAPTLMLAGIMGAALAAACIFFFFPIPTAFALNATLGIIYLIASVILFERGTVINIIHIQTPWIFSSAALFGYRHLSSEREKRHIKNIFSKYVSPEVLREILRDPAHIRLGGEEKEITLLFSDIRGFTSISERMPPTELVRILNRYFSVMTEEVLRHGGVLDKYIGDAIMAFWGAPVADPEQADKAVATAQGMIEKLAVLNREFAAIGDPEIAIGIGIYTGPAVVGNVGSHLRFDYTAIGDTVNAASRIEGLTKQYQTPILIGDTTRNQLKDPSLWKFVDEAAVKGKKDKIKIYGIL